MFTFCCINVIFVRIVTLSMKSFWGLALLAGERLCDRLKMLRWMCSAEKKGQYWLGQQNQLHVRSYCVFSLCQRFPSFPPLSAGVIQSSLQSTCALSYYFSFHAYFRCQVLYYYQKNCFNFRLTCLLFRKWHY